MKKVRHCLGLSLSVEAPAGRGARCGGYDTVTDTLWMESWVRRKAGPGSKMGVEL